MGGAVASDANVDGADAQSLANLGRGLTLNCGQNKDAEGGAGDTGTEGVEGFADRGAEFFSLRSDRWAEDSRAGEGGEVRVDPAGGLTLFAASVAAGGTMDDNTEPRFDGAAVRVVLETCELGGDLCPCLLGRVVRVGTNDAAGGDGSVDQWIALFVKCLPGLAEFTRRRDALAERLQMLLGGGE